MISSDRHNICVCFHSADAELRFGDEQRWIVTFCQNLSKLLVQLNSIEPKILLADEKSALSKSEIESLSALIFISTPNSIAHEACIHTIQTFHQYTVSKYSQVPIFNLVTNPDFINRQPKILRSFSSFTLFKTPKSEIISDFTIEEESNLDHQAYWLELIKLSSALRKFLVSDNFNGNNIDPEIATITKTQFNDQKNSKDLSTEAIRDNGKNLYLIYDFADSEYIRVVCDFLQENGYFLLQPEFGDSLVNRRKTHEHNLVIADVVIIFYGSSSKQWLQMKFLDLLKASGFGKANSFRGKAIYNFQKDTSLEAEARKYNFTIIEHSDGFSALALENFLNNLKGINE